jgi:hypothetical protein
LIKSEKTVTRSFRISELALKILQEDSQRQNVSVNTLVNQILLSYVNFDRYAKKFNFLRFSSIALRYLLESIPDEAIIHVSYNAGKEVSEPFILSKEGVLTLDSILDYLRNLSIYGNLFEYNEVIKDDKKTITLTHTLGPKGSLFIAHYLQPLFERIGVNAYFSLSEHTVLIEIKESS